LPRADPSGSLTPSPTHSPPYALPDAIFGGIPSVKIDVPITGVFTLLYAIGAFIHITTHKRNGKRSHKFHLSGLIFDFCMMRVVTCVIRIVWSTNPESVAISIPAQIMLNAG
jgi:hypothetical protein